MDYYQQIPYQPLPQQPEIDYRQQGQFFPGGPSGGGAVNQRLTRLERQIERLDRQFDQLNRRVDRIERRLGFRQDEY